MKNSRTESRKQRIPLIILLLLPLFIGWEDINIRELLSLKETQKQKKEATEKKIKEEISSLNIAPLRIIQKMNSAIFEAGGLKCKMDIWLQHPLFHSNIHLDQELENLDKAYITGRTSISLLVPGTKFSSSEWIQSYSLGARSFIFNSEKKRWDKEKLKLSSEKELEQVEYGIFQSLAAPKTDSILEDTVSIISLQKYRGRDCFVLQFNIDSAFFKKWGVSGKIDGYKAWIDRDSFYPYLFRLEGSIGDSKFLEIADYSDFNSGNTLKLPAEITQQIEKENNELLQKTNNLIEKIKALRGGSVPQNLKIEFADRKKIRRYIKDEIEKYDPQELNNQEIILKWLGLMPRQYDYKDMLINTSASSIAGYYEPKEKAFYIAEWIPENLAEPVFNHELMHTFQDNSIDLEKFLQDTTCLDRFYARKFLIEGEATAVMLQFVFDKQNKNLENNSDLLSLIKEKLSENNASSSKTDYSTLTFSGYAYGARFIQRVINSFGWKGLDRLYQEPPQTMKEIMHPEIYFEKRQGADETKRPAPEIKGWKKFHQDKLGEFIVKMWLEGFLTDTDPEILAEALKKDEIFLYKESGKDEPLKIFITEWTSNENAKKLWDAFLKLQNEKLKDKTNKQEGKNYVTWHFEDKDELININEKQILIASGPRLDKERIDILLAILGP